MVHPTASSVLIGGPARERWCLAALVALLGLWVIWLLGVAYVRGICCYDDASFAVLSRNLAEGRGYSLPFRFHGGEPFVPHAFEALTGTGPTSILPVAAAIRLFGAEGWVPGAAHVVMQFMLLAWIGTLVTRSVGAARALAYCAGALSLAMLLTSSKHFEQWYAQLGEAPAALLVACAIVNWCYRDESPRSAALSGLFLGLAVTCKELAGIFVLGFALVAGFDWMRRYRSGRWHGDDTRALLGFVLCGVAPFLAFEAWRYTTLGHAGFLHNWREHLAFIGGDSRPPSGLAATVARVSERLAVIQSRFHLGLPSAALVAAGSVFMVWRGGVPRLRRAAALLLAGLLPYTAYWLVLSNGWPRYLFMAVVLWGFLVALPLLEGMLWRSRAAALLAGGLALSWVVGESERFTRLTEELRLVNHGPNADEKRVIAYLDGLGLMPETQVYTSGWAHIAALEYFATHPARFQNGAVRVLATPGPPILAIAHMRLLRRFPDHAYVAALARCGAPVFQSGPYIVHRCARGPQG